MNMHINRSRSVHPDADNSSITLELTEKARAYGNFLDETLYPRLEASVAAREKVEEDIKEYEDLLNKIELLVKRRNLSGAGKRIQEPLHGVADLGHELAYCRAVVDDPETIFVDVGYGFHIEFGLKEASSFVQQRIQFLQQFRLAKCVKESNEVAMHYSEGIKLLESFREEIEKSKSRYRGSI